MRENAANAGAVTEEAFQKINQTAGQQLKQLGGSVEALFTEIGAVLLPVVTNIVSRVSELVKGISEAFISLNPLLLKRFSLL